MEKLEVASTTVYFPFKPYNIQLEFMKKVILTIKDGTNAVLESPTGTGKVRVEEKASSEVINDVIDSVHSLRRIRMVGPVSSEGICELWLRVL